MEDNCGICGDKLYLQYCYQIPLCKHKFHYECLQKSLEKNKDKCPYCRSKCGYLPIVNGLKKIKVGVHVSSYADLIDSNGESIYNELRCNYILQRGKNKGKLCNKKCKLGYYQCSNHINNI